MRTEPSNDVDFQLLEKMKAVTNQDMVKSASLPVKWKVRQLMGFFPMRDKC